MLAAIESGDLPAVMEITGALTSDERRPVIETSICIGFTDGRQFEILAWLAAAIGTLKITKEPWGARLQRVKSA